MINNHKNQVFNKKLAKDGTQRGGVRPGAGRPRKAMFETSASDVLAALDRLSSPGARQALFARAEEGSRDAMNELAMLYERAIRDAHAAGDLFGSSRAGETDGGG